MPEHNHQRVPQLPAGLQSFPYQFRPDTLTLVSWQNSHWAQCQGRNAPLICFDVNAAEKDVPYDAAINFGHQR